MDSVLWRAGPLDTRWWTGRLSGNPYEVRCLFGFFETLSKSKTKHATPPLREEHHFKLLGKTEEGSSTSQEENRNPWINGAA